MATSTPKQPFKVAANAPKIGQNTSTVTTGATPGLSYTATTASGAVPTSGKTRVPTYTSEYVQPDITATQFVTNQVYQSLLGRNASAQEVQQYHEQFTEYAKTHPIMTRQSIYDTSGTTGLSPYTPVRDVTTQKMPLSEQDFISNIVRQGPETKGYQAATSYFDAMRSAMGQFRGGF
jgi:hypothetical protein